MLRTIELIFYISYKYAELTFNSKSKWNIYKLSTLDAALYSFDGLLFFFVLFFVLVIPIFFNLSMTQEVLLFTISYVIIYILCHWYLCKKERYETIIRKFDERFALKKWQIILYMISILIKGVALSCSIFLWRYRLNFGR